MERGRGRYIAPKNPENSGSSSGFIILLVLCCCSVLVVLGIYGAAEGSDNNKTGIETLQELFEGKITLEDVFSNIEKGGDTSVPCQGSWSNWSACSKPCGSGTRTRTWTTTAEPLYGGARCPSPLTQEEACNTGACPPEPCEGSWSSWSACSAPCGGGIKTKTWTTTKEPKYGGTACPSPKIQSADCNTQACPIDCVGEWKESNNSCDFGCGTTLEGTFYYDIKTSAAHGGAACPHAQDTSKTKNCDLPSCPTVNTTETIGGIKYDVKYYDRADGHNAYTVSYHYDINYPTTGTIWNGQVKSTSDYGAADDPIIGSDGHGYLKGVKMKGPYDRSTYYVVKRSQQPIPQGKCELNKAYDYKMKLAGNSDYECAGKCVAQTSKSTCEDTRPGKTCDYIRDGVSSYEPSSRVTTSLKGACKWVPEGEEQSFTEPTWSGCCVSGPKKLSGNVIRVHPGQNPYRYEKWNGTVVEVTLSEAREKTKKICLSECYNEPTCTGVNTNFPVFAAEPENTCTLYSGEVNFGKRGSSITGSRGYKLTR